MIKKEYPKYEKKNLKYIGPKSGVSHNAKIGKTDGEVRGY